MNRRHFLGLAGRAALGAAVGTVMVGSSIAGAAPTQPQKQPKNVNLLQNPSFEQPTTGTVIPGWSVS